MHILFFAHLKDVTCCTEMNLSGSAANPDDLWRKLLLVHPALEGFRGSVRLARNSEYVGPDAGFDETDEVALIPPVSGG